MFLKFLPSKLLMLQGGARDPQDRPKTAEKAANWTLMAHEGPKTPQLALKTATRGAQEG